jgi:hypothetical protein
MGKGGGLRVPGSDGRRRDSARSQGQSAVRGLAGGVVICDRLVGNRVRVGANDWIGASAQHPRGLSQAATGGVYDRKRI